MSWPWSPSQVPRVARAGSRRTAASATRPRTTSPSTDRRGDESGPGVVPRSDVGCISCIVRCGNHGSRPPRVDQGPGRSEPHPHRRCLWVRREDRGPAGRGPPPAGAGRASSPRSPRCGGPGRGWSRRRLQPACRRCPRPWPTRRRARTRGVADRRDGASRRHPDPGGGGQGHPRLPARRPPHDHPEPGEEAPHRHPVPARSVLHRRPSRTRRRRSTSGSRCSTRMWPRSGAR